MQPMAAQLNKRKTITYEFAFRHFVVITIAVIFFTNNSVSDDCLLLFKKVHKQDSKKDFK